MTIPPATAGEEMHLVIAEMSATVWKLSVADGAQVDVGDVVAILESMKMEIPVEADWAGSVHFLVQEGAEITEGGTLAEIRSR
jgi:acetyl-CoA carboxylase biotin carboxyl carrier protein